MKLLNFDVENNFLINNRQNLPINWLEYWKQNEEDPKKIADIDTEAQYTAYKTATNKILRINKISKNFDAAIGRIMETMISKWVKCAMIISTAWLEKFHPIN